MKRFGRRKNNKVIDLRDAAANAAAASTLDDERDTAERVLRWYATDSTPVFGAPTRCPECGTYGMVDAIDRIEGITHNSCVACGVRWTLSRRSLPTSRPAAAPSLGDGILVRDLPVVPREAESVRL